MAREKQTLRTGASTIDLNGTREVRIGAYARRQWRRRVMLGVFGAGLVAAAFGLYVCLRPGGAIPGGGSTYPVAIHCEACRFEGTVQASVHQTFPMKCPQCGAPAAVELWACRDCRARFVPQSDADVQRCPKCGSDQVGTAAIP